MAMMDYGFIAKKNNTLLYPEKGNIFMDMKTAVGCSIEEIDGNYFTYLGDKDMFVAVYKTHFIIFVNGKEAKSVYRMNDDNLTYKKYRLKFNVNGVEFDLKRLGQSQFKLRFRYKNDVYVIIYGYMVYNQTEVRNKKDEKEFIKWYKHIRG